MKNKLLIIGTALLAFGIINLLWYLPYDAVLVQKNNPFPFTHMHDIEFLEQRQFDATYTYDPYSAAINDPLWLAWSLSLYAGMAMLSTLAFNELRKKSKKTIARGALLGLMFVPIVFYFVIMSDLVIGDAVARSTLPVISQYSSDSERFAFGIFISVSSRIGAGFLFASALMIGVFLNRIPKIPSWKSKMLVISAIITGIPIFTLSALSQSGFTIIDHWWLIIVIDVVRLVILGFVAVKSSEYKNSQVEIRK